MSYLLKFAVVLFGVCCIAFGAKAQIGFDYAQYDVGVAGGINKVYGDAETFTSTPSVHLNFTYNVSPYNNYVVELQLGQLKGGDINTTLSGRQFANSFTSVMFRKQVQFGEYIDYSQSSMANAFKNLYISTGVGFVVNHITSINRYSVLVPGYYTPGDLNSNEILIPVRLGYEFKIFNQYNQPNIKIDLGYQYNFILGDGLDGFTVGTKRDAYQQFTLGVKFSVGTITSYKKQISY